MAKKNLTDNNKPTGVYLFSEWIQAANVLSGDDFKDFIIKLHSYAIDETEPDFKSDVTKALFIIFRPRIDESRNNYASMLTRNRQNSQSGKLKAQRIDVTKSITDDMEIQSILLDYLNKENPKRDKDDAALCQELLDKYPDIETLKNRLRLVK